jgi:hypothetical protein
VNGDSEQFNPDWAAQVSAMQRRATQLGQAERLVYFWPKGACTEAAATDPISAGWPCPNQVRRPLPEICLRVTYVTSVLVKKC